MASANFICVHDMVKMRGMGRVVDALDLQQGRGTGWSAEEYHNIAPKDEGEADGEEERPTRHNTVEGNDDYMGGRRIVCLQNKGRETILLA